MYINKSQVVLSAIDLVINLMYKEIAGKNGNLIILDPTVLWVVAHIHHPSTSSAV
jgi:hypothetical protein